MTAPLISDAAGFDELCERLAVVDAYALDTEFHRERTYYPHVALVQLAWRDAEGATQVALVDPLAVDLAPFAKVLESDAVAVLHASEQDLEVLQVACGTVPRRLFDTQVAAGFVGFPSASLSLLVERLAGVRLPKGDRLTNWTKRPLTAGQLDYAASDVLHLLDLRDALVAKLQARDRLAWAEDECTQLLGRSREPNNPKVAWWRMKDARSLRGKARGVAQEVAAWREERARRMDMPPRFVLPDMALSGIAHKAPSAAADLRELRGLEGRGLKPAVVEEVLAAVRRGRELPTEELCLPQVDELERTLRPAVTLVSAWIAQLARDAEIDAAVLATRNDLHALLRGDPEARLASGWRRDLVGEPIRRLVEGEAALAFDGKGNLVLEDRARSN